MTDLDGTVRPTFLPTVNRSTNAEVGIVLHLADGTIAACNAAAQALLGMTIEQLQNASSTNRPWQTIHPDGTDFPGETHPAMVALSTGKPCCNVVMGLYRPDGELVWFNVDAYPLFQGGNDAPYAVSANLTRLVADAGQVIGHSVEIDDRVYADDIITRQRADAALYETALRLDLVQEATQSGIWDWNFATNQASVSQQYCTILGFAPDTAVVSYEQWIERIHPDDRAVASERVSQAIEQHSDYAIQYRVLHPDSVRWIDSRGKVYRDSSHRPVRMLGNVQDITEYKAAEAALRQSEAFKNRLLDSSPDCIKLLDLNGKLLYMNAGGLCAMEVEDFTPYRNVEWFDFWQGDGRQEAERALEMARAGEMSVFRGCCLTLKGTPKWWEVIVSPILNAARQVEQVLAISRDISERLRVEDDRRQAEVDLQQLTASLRDSTNRLAVALDAAQLGTWEVDLTVQPYVTASRSLRHDQIYGYESLHPNWDYDTFISHIHPDDRALIAEKFQQTVTTGEDWTVECRIIRADQTEGWIWIRGSVYEDETRQTRRLIGLNADITEDKAAAIQLRDRQERLEAALFASETGTFRWNIRTNELDWDENLARLFGLQPGQTAQNLQSFIGMVHPDDRQGVIDRCNRCATEGADFDMDFRVVYPDGSIHWLSDKGKTSFGMNGQPASMTGACTDITNRKQAEAELLQKNAIINAVSELTPTLIYVKDRAGRMRMANAAVIEAVGLPESDVLGHTSLEFHQPREAAEQITENDRKVMESGQTHVVEESLHSPTGWRVFQSVKSPYRNSAGEVIGLVGISTDITDRVQLERDREQVLQQAQAAREAADRANQIKDEFLAVLSHELRTPLSPILGWARILKTRRLDPLKTQEAVSIIERNAQLQVQLIQDLLDISCVLQGKLTLNRNPVNLELVITSAQETVQLAAEAKQITIVPEFKPQIGQVLGDAGRLQQVVWNLMTNAVKFTPEGGHITVRLSRVNHHAQLQVIDNGQGISPEFLPYVFERFRQADSSSTRKFGGLGLGLAIVRQLVELHGGTIEAESPGEGQGATFTVYLPVLEASNGSPAELLDSTASDYTEDSALRGCRILVVDDDPDSREFVAFVLEQNGAIVTQAPSAQKALALLSRTLFDVLVSDIGMPEINGYSLIQQVRAKPPEQGGKIPALALTAYASDLDAQQALQAGFGQHLSKPIDPDRLVLQVANLLQEG